MKKEVIATGKTIEDAIVNACTQLGVDREDSCVSIEVLETPTKGFLGIGGNLARVNVSFEEEEENKAEAFLKSILSILEVDADIQMEHTEEALRVNLEGPDMRLIIGRRGETLDALQYLTSLVVNKGQDSYQRVTLDTENYRQKREEALVRLANKLAEKAVKYRRNVALEPMNPYERRIIHSALQDYPSVETYSSGSEPNRKVVVAYAPNKSKEAE